MAFLIEARCGFLQTREKAREIQMLGTGLIHIYYGDGKGKTTAAMGQAVRAAGSGLKVLVFQFMKDNSSSERKAL